MQLLTKSLRFGTLRGIDAAAVSVSGTSRLDTIIRRTQNMAAQHSGAQLASSAAELIYLKSLSRAAGAGADKAKLAGMLTEETLSARVSEIRGSAAFKNLLAAESEQGLRALMNSERGGELFERYLQSSRTPAEPGKLGPDEKQPEKVSPERKPEERGKLELENNQPQNVKSQDEKKPPEIDQAETQNMMSRSPSAKQRLDQLIASLTEQSELRKQVKNGQLDKKDPRILRRQELSNKLIEAFAMVELGYAAGTKDIKVDKRCTNFMCQALRSKNGAQYNGYMVKLQEEMPDANLNRLHAGCHADMRKAINESMLISDLVGERLEKMTEFLKDADSAFGQMRNHAEKLEAENNDLGVNREKLKRQNKKPENNNKNPGL